MFAGEINAQCLNGAGLAKIPCRMPEQTSTLRLLKPGVSWPPLFVAHGLGGDVMEVAALAQHTICEQPVYGVQARGLEQTTLPDDTVEKMASYCHEQITGFQSTGPYLLAGISFGGLVMLEVARQLALKGETVSLLAFLDTFPAPQYWPLKAWIAVMGRRSGEHVRLLVRVPLWQALPQLVQLWQGFLGHLRRRGGQAAAVNSSPSDRSDLYQLRNASALAMARYKPPFYAGKVTFLKSEVSTRFPDRPEWIWANLTGTLEVHKIPGDHLAMITTQTKEVGAVLGRCINSALQSFVRAAPEKPAAFRER